LGENIKKYISKKNMLEHLGICQSVVEEDQIYKIEKFDNVFSIDESFVFIRFVFQFISSILSLLEIKFFFYLLFMRIT